MARNLRILRIRCDEYVDRYVDSYVECVNSVNGKQVGRCIALADGEAGDRGGVREQLRARALDRAPPVRRELALRRARQSVLLILMLPSLS